MSEAFVLAGELALPRGPRRDQRRAGGRTTARQAVERFGTIDVLLNKAGLGLIRAVEEGRKPRRCRWNGFIGQTSSVS